MTRPNVRGAFVRGCRCVLLCERRSELEALCKGFTFDGHMELSLQVSDGRRRDLGGCYKITDAAVTAVAAACPQLTSLDLGGCCKITDVAVTARAAERANSVRGAVVCHSHGLAAVPGQLWSVAAGNVANKDAIREAGGIPPLVALAQDGTEVQKEIAARALWYLLFGVGQHIDIRKAIVAAGGIAPLAL